MYLLSKCKVKILALLFIFIGLINFNYEDGGIIYFNLLVFET